MFVRKTLAGVIAATLAGSVVALAGPASAAVDPDDTTFTPTAADLIGVGSDTSQHALKLFADAWNAESTSAKIATFAATGGGQITLPSGTINRPNGSGAGKSLLYGSGNNVDIDFARSSSAQSTAETQAGLQSFPFALDTLVMAVSNSTRRTRRRRSPRRTSSGSTRATSPTGRRSTRASRVSSRRRSRRPARARGASSPRSSRR